ncbi:hypothetical protein PPL_08670 [Heterostelium album PN500]|uniref:Transmembrane 9 superfamily member n=1 Tax=Heterostelium pallidum (strain ATCC 26659 / Pp 5 / PN500) TaxID=670386 RepID=D3BJE5_HETP5|nr:hypothetical protein PPL_08670 [Heterostelium album PN500]EFA78025.1 hypothetical protein PPL_08670 [Heterostelium album PN500]|eukprot:XP_020430153.1 hypothetical protein PPL_08670 [Heterostelium album PN500]
MKSNNNIYIIVLVIVLFILTNDALQLEKKKTYKIGDPLPIYVNKLISQDKIFSYSYYDLPFCKPENGLSSQETIGQVLNGERKQLTPYNVTFLQPTSGFQVINKYSGCDIFSYRNTNDKLAEFIKAGYCMEMEIDDLVAYTWSGVSNDNAINIGDYWFDRANNQEILTINNHLYFTIQYNKVSEDEYTIVGLRVFPQSRQFNLQNYLYYGLSALMAAPNI